MAPKGLHARCPGSHDVTLHGRRECAGVAKGPEVGSSSWTARAGPWHRDPGGNGVIDEAELGAAPIQGGGRAASQGVRAPLGAGEARRQVLLEQLGGASLRHPERRTSNLQNCERIMAVVYGH